MKDEINAAIRTLLGKVNASINTEQALKYTQAITNLANATATLGANDREDQRVASMS